MAPKKTVLVEKTNGILPEFKFTDEDKEDNTKKQPFLSVQVQIRHDDALNTTVYRKIRHNDQLLHANSNHTISPKVACIRLLFGRV